MDCGPNATKGMDWAYHGSGSEDPTTEPYANSVLLLLLLYSMLPSCAAGGNAFGGVAPELESAESLEAVLCAGDQAAL